MENIQRTTKQNVDHSKEICQGRTIFVQEQLFLINLFQFHTRRKMRAESNLGNEKSLANQAFL
jgi:hypothetical protein